MKTLKVTLSVCCIAAALLLAAQAQGQTCPAAVANNPNQLIAGQTWAFDTRSADYFPSGMASIGYFTAQVLASQPFRGVLNVTESVNSSSLGGFPPGFVRLANIPGTYQVYPDCSGGTLAFNLNQQPVQWEFVFTNNFTTMYMVSTALTGNVSGTKSLRGTAVLSTAAACPAGMDPLQVINGTTWSFHAETASFQGNGGGRVGIFKPIFVPAGAVAANPYPHGNIAVTQSISYDGYPSVVRLGADSGRYSIYPDCSGGRLTLGGGQAATYEFVFVGAGFTRMLLLSDVLVGTPGNLVLMNTNDILAGSATRF